MLDIQLYLLLAYAPMMINQWNHVLCNLHCQMFIYVSLFSYVFNPFQIGSLKSCFFLIDCIKLYG